MTDTNANWLDQYKHVVVNLQMTMEETLSLLALLTVGLGSPPLDRCEHTESISIDLTNIMIAMSALNGKALAKVTSPPQPCMIGLATWGAHVLVKDHAMDNIVQQAMASLEAQLADSATRPNTRKYWEPGDDDPV